MSLISSLRRILYFALAEIRIARRMARLPVLIVVLALLSGLGYVFSCLTMAYVAPFSSSFGGGAPLYLLGNIDPTIVLTFHLSLLLLAFDASHRHMRNRIEEVLNVKPLSNFEVLAGRTIGIAFLVWLTVVLFVLAMQVVGLIAVATRWQFAGVLQFHSIVNLLVLDVPVTLFLWSSIIVFLTCLLRVRLAVVLVVAALMFGAMLIVVVVPYSLLPIASPISYDSLFVSDLVPQFANLSTLLVRCAFVLAGIGLLVLGSIFVSRTDKQSHLRGALTASALFVACFAAFTLATLEVSSRQAEKESWRSAHEIASAMDAPDLTRLSGSVRINPRLVLEVDLTLEFVSSGTENELFTFNPSMRIGELELDGTSSQYSFDDGLLQVHGEISTNQNDTRTLRIVAEGVPNPRFGTFDATLDYESDPSVPNRVVRFFGTDGSVYDPRYVALMPNSYWYPSPGAIARDFTATERGIDYFDVDLEVELIARNWNLVGSGITEQTEDPGVYRVSSATPVPEVGLFASKFKTASVEVAGTKFSLHVHKRHDEALNLPQESKSPLEAMAEAMTGLLSELGLDLPQGQFSIVEVPARLRMVGGGWRMDTLAALPGIVLIGERGFPTAKLDLMNRRIKQDEWESTEEQMEEYWGWLLANQVRTGLGTMNFWETASEHHWTHATSASGPDAFVLDQVIRSLVSARSADPFRFFSIHSSIFAGPLALLNLELAGRLAGAHPESATGNSMKILESEFLHDHRLSVWESVETVALSNLPDGFEDQHILELMLLKCAEIAKGLMLANDEESVFAWISDMRNRFAGTTYSRDDLLSVADEHSVVVHPFLTDWLTTEELPAFVVSKPTIRRIADDERGRTQYETSFAIRNASSVDGFVSVWIPTEEEAEWSSSSPLRGITAKIDSNVSKRLNLTSAHQPHSVYVNPMLSRNRGVMQLSLPDGEIEEDRTALPRAEESASDWAPDDSRIVVDDLDPGFSVVQPDSNTQQQAGVGPASWFDTSVYLPELENGLTWGGDQSTDYFVPPGGLWGRIGDSGAYGEYRRTYAIQWDWSGKVEPYLATFSAELPQESTWQLEFHMPSGIYWLEWIGASELTAAITVEGNGEACPAELDLKQANVGWNTIGEYTLKPGEVRVTVARVARQLMSVADAIRWTDLNEATQTQAEGNSGSPSASNTEEVKP